MTKGSGSMEGLIFGIVPMNHITKQSSKGMSRESHSVLSEGREFGKRAREKEIFDLLISS
jgi:hypothetical protein